MRRPQGRARRRPTLDELDATVGDDWEPSGGWDRGRGSLRRVTGVPKLDLPVLGGRGGCWCGQPAGHPWPGMEDGAPHPR